MTKRQSLGTFATLGVSLLVLLLVPGAIEAQEPPTIEVVPSTLSVSVPQGQEETESLSITNLGDDTLDWSVTEEGASGTADEPTGFGPLPGVDGPVHSLAVWDDGSGPALYVGGVFSQAGDVPASHIARWDGTGWSPLGSGIQGTAVFALAVYEGDLIVGGNFAFGIARWDGNGWSSLDLGVDGLVSALVVHDGALIAAGGFSQAGGAPANSIARWDGTGWSPLDSGLNGPANSLTVVDGALIAGGNFTEAGGVPANRIAQWDGSEWAPLGTGMDDIVFALTGFDGALFAGGEFSLAGDAPDTRRVARWDGVEWSSLGTGIGGAFSDVRALREYDGALIVGGGFLDAGGVPVNRIARWDGGDWTPLGSGLGGGARALAELDGELVAGGSFDTAGGVAADNIARWDGSEWSPLLPPEPVDCGLPDWVGADPPSGTVPGGETVLVDVHFDASGLAVGEYEASLCIASNDPVLPLTVVPVELMVTEPTVPALSVTPDPLDFGEVEVGETAGPLAVTLSSVGTAAVEVTGVQAITPPFASAGGDCPATPFDLEPGTSCTLSYAFTPTTAGSFEQTVEIESSADPVGFALQGVGVPGSSPPAIELTPDSLSVVLVPDQSTTEVLTISNLGSDTLEWEIESVPPALTEGVILGADAIQQRVMAFDAETGDLIDADFIPTEPQAELSLPVQVILNADQDGFLLSDRDGHVVHAYDLDGSWTGVFAPAGGPDTSVAETLGGIRISPQGTLLASVGDGANAHAIAEFDGDGHYMGNFIDNEAGGLMAPYDMLFRGSDVLISSLDSWIYRYDHTGAPLPLFSDEIPAPWQLTELDDGHVLAASSLNHPSFGGVWEMDAEGNQVSRYTGVLGNRGVYPLENGNILTSNSSGVHEIDLDGNLLETEASGEVFSLTFVQISTECGDASWLDGEPRAGSVPGGGSTDLTVTLDAEGLAPGEYETTLCIASNDPLAPVTLVPVSLTITGENPVPVLDELDPESVLAGTGGFTLHAFGNDFGPNAVLRWDGSERSTTVVSSGELTAGILASDIEEPGVFPVTVLNPAPGGGESGPLDLEVLVNAPAIHVTPDNLSARLWFDLSIDLMLTVENVGTQVLAWDFVLDDVGGACELPSWLTISGAFGGEIGPGSSVEATITLSASGLDDGDYEATICIESNDPSEPLANVPVELTVGVPEDFATLEGTVAGLGYCNEAPTVLTDAQILIVGQTEQYSVGVGEEGVYRIAIDAAEGPVDVEASAAGHVAETVEDLSLPAGETVTLPFDLVLDAPCSTVEPEALDFELSDGASESRTLTIDNEQGGGAQTWDLIDPVGAPGSAGRSGDVIWHQPLDHPGGAGFFYGARGGVFLGLPDPPADDPGVYTADDFLIESGQAIGEIRTPGFWGPCGNPARHAQYKARSISWYIYPDAGGLPAGHPEDGEAHHVWAFSGDREPTGGDPPPWDPAISFGEVCPGPGGTFCREEIRLDVVAADGGALELDDGRYWLLAVPHSAPGEVCAPGSEPLFNVWSWHRGVPTGLRAHHVDPHDLYDTGATSWTMLPAGGAPPGHTNQAFTLLSGPPGQCWDPDDVSWLTVEPTAGEIPSGESRELTVTADSSGLALGDYLIRICVNTNDPERPLVNVPVTLTVTPTPVVELAFDPPSLEFGEVEVGSTGGPLSATLTNSGTLAASGLTFALPEGPFSAETGTCVATLPPGESCDVGLTFTPAGAGSAATSLEVTSDGEASAALPVAGSGVGEPAFTPVGLVVDPGERISDGNGVLEPQEMVDVVPSWRNDGNLAASLTGTAADFTGPEGADYELADAAADYGLIESGATARCDEATEVCYRVSVNDPAVRPATHWMATFDETLDDPDGTSKTWSLHIGDSFTDVPRGNVFYEAIETLLHSGVTGGCTETEYCPAGGNTRSQMAVFLVRAAEGDPDYSPPACTEGATRFTDVPAGNLFCPWIEDLAERGVTAGCGGDNYCPNDAVTRSQMAVFLLRAALGADYTPSGCEGEFGDVPCSSPFAAWIEDLAERGITGGCGGGNYCPSDEVTRGQMAAFVTRAFDLVLYGP